MKLNISLLFPIKKKRKVKQIEAANRLLSFTVLVHLFIIYFICFLCLKMKERSSRNAGRPGDHVFLHRDFGVGVSPSDHPVHRAIHTDTASPRVFTDTKPVIRKSRSDSMIKRYVCEERKCEFSL